MVGFLKYFSRHQTATAVKPVQPARVKAAPTWQVVPNYLPADPRQHLPVVLAASAIAASESTTAKLKFKRLYRQNPEAKRVSLIATALAAATSGQQFVVKSIKKKVSDSDHAEKV